MRGRLNASFVSHLNISSVASLNTPEIDVRELSDYSSTILHVGHLYVFGFQMDIWI